MGRGRGRGRGREGEAVWSEERKEGGEREMCACQQRAAIGMSQQPQPHQQQQRRSGSRQHQQCIPRRWNGAVRVRSSNVNLRAMRKHIESSAAATEVPELTEKDAADVNTSSITSCREQTPTWLKLNKKLKERLSVMDANDSNKDMLQSMNVVAKGGGVEFSDEHNDLKVIMLGHRNNRETFGAQSYLIKLPGTLSNVMIDCPKYSDELRDAIAAHGNVRYIVMSHTDDCAGHAIWQKELSKMNDNGIPCERVMHSSEVKTGWNKIDQATHEMEIQLGDNDDQNTPSWAMPVTGPWTLPLKGYQEDSFQNPFIQLIFCPGHSIGSICINANNEYLLTGDTLCLTSRFGKLGWANKYSDDYSQETRRLDILNAASAMARGDLDYA